MRTPLGLDDHIRSFCRRQRELLETELAATSSNDDGGATTAAAESNPTAPDPAAANDEGRERGLHRLRVDDVSIGLYGRTVLRLVPMMATATAMPSAAPSDEETSPVLLPGVPPPPSLMSSRLHLPAHRFTTGDEVEIRSAHKKGHNGGGGGPSSRMVGVICEVTDDSVSVALGGGGGGGGGGGSRGDGSGGNRNNNNKSGSRPATKVASDDAARGDPEEEWAHPPLSLLSRDSVEVHRRLVAALDRLERRSSDPGRIVRALMDPTSVVVAPAASSPEPAEKAESISSIDPPHEQTMVPINANLDDSQLEAVRFCLDASCPVSCIHGPPGTGKTTTVAEVIHQAIAKQWKVLVAAPSNVAVDNVLAKLVAIDDDDSSTTTTSKGGKAKSKKKRGRNKQGGARGRIRAVRIGHPARMRPEILAYSLDSLVQGSEETAIVKDVRDELRTFVQMLSSSSSSSSTRKGGGGEPNRAVARREISSLRKEIRTREEKVVADLLGSAQVVLATCVGAANRLLADAEFDLVVIDEAAQSLEVACWIPAMLCTTKLVLAGDHKQLPPTIKSPAVQRELGYTMFERIVEQAPALSRMLQVQYRMHETIADWASRAMYQGRLVSHETVRHRTLEQLATVAADGPTRASDPPIDYDTEDGDGGGTPPFLLIDTAGCGMHENVNPAGSRYNVGEAEIVSRQVRHLIGMGLNPEQVAVITPYNGQVETLRNSLSTDFPRLDIRSVDGFQGGEREAVVISLVRSSPRSGRVGIGFLSDDRRLNVAITRSKRHCCVVCDSDTVQQSPFIRGLLEWITENGRHQSAREYLHGDHDNEPRNRDGSDMESQLLKFQKEEDPEEIAKKQAMLVEKIRAFAARGKPGAEMNLSTTLSRFDRKIVHEEAERLEIGHVSEGIEGINRRIKLFIPKTPSAVLATAAAATTDSAVQSPTPEVLQLSVGIEGDDSVPEIETVRSVHDQAFEALAGASTADSDEDSVGAVDDVDGTDPLLVEEASNTNLLAELARERRNRRSNEKKPPRAPQPTPKPKRLGGQKLGGSKKPPLLSTVNQGSTAELEEVDDMAFLDQQIEQVQNAHGRKFEGKGGYRTVMNGILNSTPKAGAPPKKDPRATAALQAKLKSAQDERKAKPKKR